MNRYDVSTLYSVQIVYTLPANMNIFSVVVIPDLCKQSINLIMRFCRSRSVVKHPPSSYLFLKESSAKNKLINHKIDGQ